MANSTYDNNLHLAIITNDYFKSMTGIDLIVEEENKERAEAKIKSFSRQAQIHLYKNKSPRTRNIFNYYISFNDNWRSAWELYVVAFIQSFYYGGDFIWGDAKVPEAVKNAILGSLLNTHNFDSGTINEIENSSEEW